MSEFLYGVIVGLGVASAFWWLILKTVAKHTKWMGSEDES